MRRVSKHRRSDGTIFGDLGERVLSWRRRSYDMTARDESSCRQRVDWLAYWIRAGTIHGDYPEEIPFVPTPIEVIDKMLELAEVKKGDVLYDLGSGDGRIVIRAAKKYGIHAVGIEMDRLLLDKARKDAKAAGVTHLVEFRDEDASQSQYFDSTVITLYMLPWFNEKIKPTLQQC